MLLYGKELGVAKDWRVRLRHNPTGDGWWKGEPTPTIEGASYQSNEVDSSKNAACEAIGVRGANGGEL